MFFIDSASVLDPEIISKAVLDADLSVNAINLAAEELPRVYNVGAVLSHPEGIAYFEEAILDAMATYNIDLVAKSVHMSLNPIRMAENVCEQLISQQGKKPSPLNQLLPPKRNCDLFCSELEHFIMDANCIYKLDREHGGF